MYRYSAYDRDEGSWIAWLSITVLAILVLIVYLISVLGTHLLLHYLNLSVLDGKLDEDDNQVLLWSAIVWTLLGLVSLVPVGLAEGLFASQHILELLPGMLAGMLGQVAVSGGYGLLVGFGVVWWLWYWQVDRSMTGLEPAQPLSLATSEAFVIDQPAVTSTNGASNGAIPVGFEWYREGVVLGEEV